MQRLFCTPLYSYKATHPDQMDMVAGEQLTILEEKLPGGWTRVQTNDQIQGKVPTSYLKIGKTIICQYLPQPKATQCNLRVVL